MKIRVERDILADAVAWAARILPQKTQLPVLLSSTSNVQVIVLVLGPR